MATFEDLHQGDRVRHAGCGLGVVSSVKDGFVEVIYDQRSEGRYSKNQNWRGKYDRDWFRICGELLAKEPR